MATKKSGNKRGRPSTLTKDVLAKLEQGFKIGLTDIEACCYANIDINALYRFERKNVDFRKQKEQWKQNPIAKAKNTIFKNLDDPKTAQWYLERKCKDEFSTKVVQDVNATGITIVTDNDHKQMLEDL